MHVSHDFGCTRAPLSPDRDPKRCQELVAQGLFVVIVFGSHYRENGSSAGGRCYAYHSSHIGRIGKIRTGRSASASGTAFFILGGASFFFSMSAKRSATSAGWISSRWRSH